LLHEVFIILYQLAVKREDGDVRGSSQKALADFRFEAVVKRHYKTDHGDSEGDPDDGYPGRNGDEKAP